MAELKPPVLLVEGKTDVYLIVQLLKQHGVFAHDARNSLSTADRKRVQVNVEFIASEPDGSGGNSHLFRDIPLRLRRVAHKAVGYVFDADEGNPEKEQTGSGLERTWQHVREQIRHSEAVGSVPSKIDLNGYRAKHQETETRIGVWLMPDNVRDGKLEDFIRDLMAGDDSLIAHADASSRSAKVDHGATFPEKDFKKAVIETWLAWQEEPGMTYGTAFQKRQLLSDADLAQRFVNWVKWLIEPNVSTPTS